MSEADTLTGSEESPVDPIAEVVHDVAPTETQEWLDSLEYVLASKGEQRVQYLLDRLEESARRQGVDLPIYANTPYINSIPRSKQPPYPGNREIERRIKSIIRWNAMAM